MWIYKYLAFVKEQIQKHVIAYFWCYLYSKEWYTWTWISRDYINCKSTSYPYFLLCGDVTWNVNLLSSTSAGSARTPSSFKSSINFPATCHMKLCSENGKSLSRVMYTHVQANQIYYIHMNTAAVLKKFRHIHIKCIHWSLTSYVSEADKDSSRKNEFLRICKHMHNSNRHPLT